MSSVFHLTKQEEERLYNFHHTLTRFFIVALSIIGRCPHTRYGSYGRTRKDLFNMKIYGIGKEWEFLYYKNYRRFGMEAKGLNEQTYLAWVVYNTLAARITNMPFTVAANMPILFEELGLGTCEGMQIKAGTVVASEDGKYLFIVLEQFPDGSMVVLTSSEYTDQTIGATLNYQNQRGEAYNISISLMQLYFPEHLEKVKNSLEFPYSIYLKSKCFNFFPFMLPDPDGLTFMSAEEILTSLAYKIIVFKNETIQRVERTAANVLVDPKNDIFYFEQDHAEEQEALKTLSNPRFL